MGYKIKALERKHFLGYLDILNVLLMSAHHPKSATGNFISSSFHVFSAFLILKTNCILDTVTQDFRIRCPFSNILRAKIVKEKLVVASAWFLGCPWRWNR